MYLFLMAMWMSKIVQKCMFINIHYLSKQGLNELINLNYILHQSAS